MSRAILPGPRPTRVWPDLRRELKILPYSKTSRYTIQEKIINMDYISRSPRKRKVPLKSLY